MFPRDATSSGTSSSRIVPRKEARSPIEIAFFLCLDKKGCGRDTIDRMTPPHPGGSRITIPLADRHIREETISPGAGNSCAPHFLLDSGPGYCMLIAYIAASMNIRPRRNVRSKGVYRGSLRTNPFRPQVFHTPGKVHQSALAGSIDLRSANDPAVLYPGIPGRRPQVDE